MSIKTATGSSKSDALMDKLASFYIPDKIKEGVKDTWYIIGPKLRDETRRLIYEPPKTGRIYNIYGRRHQASAPGQSPANLTGRLAQSNDYTVRGHDSLEFGERAPYARFLEEGTRKIAQRPHLIRAFQNLAGLIYSIMEQEGAKAFPK